MKLHEAIALRKGEIGRNKARLTKIYANFQKPASFGGFVKTYEKTEDSGEDLPGENKRVQNTVNASLEAVQSSLESLWNTVGSVEYGNCDALADIEVDGTSILANVPVTALLFLETQLTDLRTTLENIPTLSPDFEWEMDANDGLYKTNVVQTHRNKKVQKAITLVAQDEHHPGQAELITVDELAGYWNSVQHSGAMPAVRKAVIVGRVESMLDAVKAARARANSNDAPSVSMANILQFIFA